MSDYELKAIVERELNMYDARWYHLCDEDNGIALDKAWLARGVIWEVARRVAEAERERAADLLKAMATQELISANQSDEDGRDDGDWFQNRHDVLIRAAAAIRNRKDADK